MRVGGLGWSTGLLVLELSCSETYEPVRPSLLFHGLLALLAC